MRDNDSYIYRRGTTPNTQVVISQKNKVFSIPIGQQNFSQIGVLSSFSPGGQDRTVDLVRGLGYGDQIAELVPGVTGVQTLEVTRTLLYLSNVFQVFGYRGGVDGLVRSLKHHQWPFDVKQEMVFSRIATLDPVPKIVVQASDSVNAALLTFYEACWMASYSTAGLEAETSMVTESCSMPCTDVLDGVSTYGELAADAQSTGNNPFVGVGSFRYSNSGTAAPTPA